MTPETWPCFICGHRLETYQIRAEIDGAYIDYKEREQGEIAVYICDECWSKLNELWGKRKKKIDH